MQQLQKHKNTDIFQLVWLRGVHHTAESSDQNLSKNFAMCNVHHTAESSSTVYTVQCASNSEVKLHTKESKSKSWLVSFKGEHICHESKV